MIKYLMKKVENVYSPLFEPQEFEKHGFREWGDVLHHENDQKPLKTISFYFNFTARNVPN